MCLKAMLIDGERKIESTYSINSGSIVYFVDIVAFLGLHGRETIVPSVANTLTRETITGSISDDQGTSFRNKWRVQDVLF